MYFPLSSLSHAGAPFSIILIKVSIDRGNWFFFCFIWSGNSVTKWNYFRAVLIFFSIDCHLLANINMKLLDAFNNVSLAKVSRQKYQHASIFDREEGKCPNRVCPSIMLSFAPARRKKDLDMRRRQVTFLTRVHVVISGNQWGGQLTGERGGDDNFQILSRGNSTVSYRPRVFQRPLGSHAEVPEVFFFQQLFVRLCLPKVSQQYSSALSWESKARDSSAPGETLACFAWENVVLLSWNKSWK